MKRMKKQDIFPGMKYTQLSVRVWEDWLDLIRRAAEKTGVSVPEFVRASMLPIACDVLGIPEPEYPPLDKRGAPTIQSYAAREAGMKVGDWKRAALNAMAQQAIKMIESTPPPMSTKHRTKQR